MLCVIPYTALSLCSDNEFARLRNFNHKLSFSIGFRSANRRLEKTEIESSRVIKAQFASDSEILIARSFFSFARHISCALCRHVITARLNRLWLRLKSSLFTRLPLIKSGLCLTYRPA